MARPRPSRGGKCGHARHAKFSYADRRVVAKVGSFQEFVPSDGPAGQRAFLAARTKLLQHLNHIVRETALVEVKFIGAIIGAHCSSFLPESENTHAGRT